MRRKTQAAALVAAVGTLGSMGGMAQAETDTQIHRFDFRLDEQRLDNGDLEFRGFENLSFDQFDASDGRTLNSATLEVDTTIRGALNVFQRASSDPELLPTAARGPDNLAPAAEGQEEEFEPPEFEFESAAELGTFEFVAEADFGDYDFEDVEPINERQVRITNAGQGSNSTQDVANFLGTGTLGGDVGAHMSVEYAPTSAGAAAGFRSFGQVRLIYDFDAAQTPPPSTTIPTPSAAAAGLALLGLAALRRRRR